MIAGEHFSPEFPKKMFHCPHCNVYAMQLYAYIQALGQLNVGRPMDSNAKFSETLPFEWALSRCSHCSKVTIWNSNEMVYPRVSIVKEPNSDLSEEIKADYREAAAIFGDSPRAAAALLRLALQKLCKSLGQKGENINEDIKKMVEQGLNPLVQKSLDALRLTGNSAVHPSEINLSEEPGRVFKLFELLNFIAEKMITEPRQIEKFYSELPESGLEAIKIRDGNK
jgi:hypothetical protein